MHRATVHIRSVLAGLILASLGLASVTPPGEAAAQGFGFLFDRPAHRPVRTARRRPARTVMAASHPSPVPAPLPVPRPHFPGDVADEPPSIVALPQTAATPPAPVVTRPEATEATGGPCAGGSGTKDVAAEPSKTPSSEPAKAPGVAPVTPSGADASFNPRQVPLDNACPGRLAAGAVDAAPTTPGPQPDARCTVVQPVRLSGVTLADGSKVAFPDHPTIACETADTFARYVRELLVPLARGSYGSPIDAVWTGPGLECRARDHVRGAKLSAHGQGLAIDIAQLKLADGRRIDVGAPRTPTDQGFETAARAAACGYFHTTLGPGSDSYHRNHWHFDLEQRGRTGDMKYCK